jgi:hypothetical protein
MQEIHPIVKQDKLELRQTTKLRNNSTTKVWLVSKFLPSRCGVANYSTTLYENLSSAKSVNLSLSRTSPSGHFWPIKLVWFNFRHKFEVAHFQHEFLLYGSPYISLLKIMQVFLGIRILNRRTRIIMTMHSVPSNENLIMAFKSYGFAHILRLQRNLAKAAIKLLTKMPHTIIVHSSEQLHILMQDYSVKRSKIRLIPHGV